jgi:O-antigen/teichoic acid export membrane protein
MSSIVSSLANPASAVLYGYEKQAFIYKYGFFLACLNIGLDLLLIKHYGAFGAAIAYAVTTLCASIGGMAYTCRTMKLTYPLLSLSKILFSTIIMGTVMEIIILHNHEIPGFVLSLIAGLIVYLVCSLVLGTFEKEDYVLMRSVQNVLPERMKWLFSWGISFMEEFKPGRE